MPGFRYAQFCPLARAAEVLGERWTLPVIRELFVGPQRFSDLRRRLASVSSSVLAARLARLEELGVIAKQVMPPPAASTVYTLTDSGRALFPVMRELMRWGLRFLLPPQPGDQIEPEWVHLGLSAFARSQPTPPRSFEIRIPREGEMLRVRVEGGPAGTLVEEGGTPAELAFTAPPMLILGLASGRIDGEAAARDGHIQVEGNAATLADFPALFEIPFPPDPAEPSRAAASESRSRNPE